MTLTPHCPPPLPAQARLNYISSEVHASFGPLFNPALTGEAKEAQLAKLYTKLQYLVNHDLKNRDYLVGDAFTVGEGRGRTRACTSISNSCAPLSLPLPPDR